MEKQHKGILIILIILVIAVIILSFVLAYFSRKQTIVTEENQIEINSQKLENKSINTLANMDEMQRMKYYLTEFILAIENKEYEEAYGYLNKEFKSNFFKTYEEFENYAKTKFPKEISLKYENFERNGSLYIFWVILTNPLTSSKNQGLEMNFVIKENELNNFEMSFSVI